MDPDLENKLDSLVEDLVKVRLRCQPVIAIVGSGISCPQIPDMMTIINRAIELYQTGQFSDDEVLRRYPDLTTKEGLIELFQHDPDPVLRKSPLWKNGVMGWLRDLEEKAAPEKQHSSLMGLLRCNLLRAIVTPNWDCLLERATETDHLNGLSDYLIIRDHQLLSSWIQRPRALPAIIKLHGDVRERRCRNGHVSADNIPTQQGPLYCPQCGEKTDSQLLLPDSARRASMQMIEFLTGRNKPPSENAAPIGGEKFSEEPGERFNYLGAILVIGFSGSYDRHLQELITKRAEQNCLIAHIDIKPRSIFGENLLEGKASDLVPALAQKWQQKTQDLPTGQQWAPGQIPPLNFVQAEERFDSLFGRIPVTEQEASILSHPEFSRLRHIKQLGQKQRFYPSADHSRFEHSVASLKVVDELYGGLVEALQRERNRGPHALAGYHPTVEERKLLRLAALFHDFGHIWFSHLGEKVLEELVGSEAPTGGGPLALKEIVKSAGGGHEGFTKEFLEHSQRKKGKQPLVELVQDVVSEVETKIGITIDDFYTLLAGQSRRLGHLNCLVASSIDADKLEYLNRDASRTGKAGANNVRLDVIAQSLEITEFGQTAVQLDAVSVVERVAAERYLMFQSVYHDDRVRALESSLVQVLVDYLSFRLNGEKPQEVYKVLLKREAELIDEVKKYINEGDDQSPKPEQRIHRDNHWLEVLDLVSGEGKFPRLEVWMLHPARHIRELPLEDARKAVDRAYKMLRKDLGDLFRTRYRHRAVFALDRFNIHVGISEVPISGENSLYAPGDVSPLIAGLQDVRKCPIRLAVLYYDPKFEGACREEVEATLLRQVRDFEVTVRRKPPEKGQYGN